MIILGQYILLIQSELIELSETELNKESRWQNWFQIFVKKQIFTHNRRAERKRDIVEGEDEENIKMYSAMVNWMDISHRSFISLITCISIYYIYD